MAKNLLEKLVDSLHQHGYDKIEFAVGKDAVLYHDKEGITKEAMPLELKLFGYISHMTHEFELDFVRFMNEFIQHMNQRHHDQIYIGTDVHQIQEHGNQGFLIKLFTLASKDVAPATLFDFSRALEALKDGREIQRAGWNGANQRVFLHTFATDMQPCFVLINAQGKKQPGWVPSMGDLLADDWKFA